MKNMRAEPGRARDPSFPFLSFMYLMFLLSNNPFPQSC
jgi:hypothetical protein